MIVPPMSKKSSETVSPRTPRTTDNSDRHSHPEAEPLLIGNLAVFRIESKMRPNYGKSVGMNASEWWANVRGISTCMMHQTAF